MVKLKRQKEEIINKAEELAKEYEAKYRGCGQCTFLAIVDALRWGGLEIIPEDMENRLASGLSLLTGGTAMSGDGTCGAIASSAIAAGMALQVSLDDIESIRRGAVFIRNTILYEYCNKYNSILCKDIQMKRYGKAWDLSSDEMAHEFLGLSGGCTIMDTAKLAVQCILYELEK